MKNYLILIFAISLISVWPFLKKGYFKSHDGEWMVIRFTAFHQSLADGQFPVRFTKRLNSNYGYPVFNFLYPGPFYMAEIPKLLGLSYVNSIKAVFIFSSIGSSLLMFWALSKKYSFQASFAGSITYLFAPYRFVDMYVRGSLGESTAFLAPPLILAVIFALNRGKTNLLLFLPFAVSFLILAHNVSAIIFLPFLMFYAYTILSRSRFISFLKFSTLGVALSSFFAIPALADLGLVRLSQIKVADTLNYLVPISKLIYSQHGFGSNPNDTAGLSVQIGIVSLLSLSVGVAALILKKKMDTSTKYTLITLLITILLMTRHSSFLWANIPFIDIIQFPWRLLSLIVLLSSILVAQTLDATKSYWISTIMVVISIVTTIQYIQPSEWTSYDDSYYSTNEDTTTVKDEYLPLWVQKRPTSRANTASVQNSDLSFDSEEINNQGYNAILNASQNTRLTINTIYFPGFYAKIDGKRTNIEYTANTGGLMNIQLPKGRHEVIIKYSKSPIHLASEIISIIALLLTGVLFFRKWQKQNF